MQLKEAMIENKEKINSIIEDIIPQTSAIVVAQVMDDLNSMKNGTIRKRELKRALLTFNDEY